MWSFSAGTGLDMIQIFSGLLDMFEAGAAEKKPVLEITGGDVAAFCDELLSNVKTYTENWREKLNRDIREKLEGDSNEKK
jgi:DNA-binding ferritin-like protein (Dps family)